MPLDDFRAMLEVIVEKAMQSSTPSKLP